MDHHGQRWVKFLEIQYTYLGVLVSCARLDHQIQYFYSIMKGRSDRTEYNIIVTQILIHYTLPYIYVFGHHFLKLDDEWRICCINPQACVLFVTASNTCLRVFFSEAHTCTSKYCIKKYASINLFWHETLDLFWRFLLHYCV